MGHNPIPRVPRPYESLTALSALRGAYVYGKIDVEKFEELVEDAIQGVWDCITPIVLPRPGGLSAPNTGKVVRC